MKTFLLSLALLLPQLPDIPIAPGPRVSIEGVVLGNGNAPVAGAEVSAFWSPAPAAYGSNQVPKTATDKDGHFLIKDLGAGGYRLMVTAGGYAYQEYGAKPGRNGGMGTVTTLTPGQAVSGITIRLTGEGVISGRVTSTNGQPLLGMEVFAFRRTFDAFGWPALAPDGQRGNTNDRGEYRLTGLAPGKYFVRAASPFGGLAEAAQIRAAVNGGVPIDTSPGQYADTFYPGVTESAKASLVETTSGGEIRNVDIPLPRQQTYRIRGRAVDPSSQDPAERVMMGTLPARADFVSVTSMSIRPYHPDGTFELEGLTPGTYWVRAQVPGPPITPEQRQLMSTPGGADRLNLPAPAMGIALVNVVDSDVDNVEVRIVKDLHVDGTINVEGRQSSATEISALKVDLHQILTGRLNPTGVGNVRMSPEGSFTTTNLPVAEYKLTMSELPPDLYLKEARLGNMDALTELLTLTTQPTAPLKIVLAKGSEVRGVVTAAAANQQVVLVPEGKPNRPDLYKTATTDANGRFVIQGVAPGDYKAYAWKTLEPFRYFDAEFVQQFQERGSAVHVVDGAAATANVTLIP